jgi:hypothetical protein
MQVRRARAALAGVPVLPAAGCAGTPPEPTYAQKIVADARVCAPDTVEVSIEAGTGVTLKPEETQRVASKIKSKIDGRKASNPRAGEPHAYQVPEHALAGQFDLQKTFAWGGVYGASVSVETIEDTFADGVAET